MTRAFPRSTVLATLILTYGCSSYSNAKPLDAVPMPADPNGRYEVWSGREKWELHALRVDGDTVRGVRWWHDPSCDSCQVALAKSAVDSVRVPRYDGGKTGALALFVAPFVAIALLWIAFVGSEGGT